MKKDRELSTQEKNFGFKGILYVDLDDCLLKTSEAIIKILQEYFLDTGEEWCTWPMEKCLSELKKWNYSNFTKNRLTKKRFLKMFESERFWELVQVDEDFLHMLNGQRDNYLVIFVSKGTEKNLLQKLDFLDSLVQQGRLKEQYFGFVGIRNGVSKSIISMSDGVQIDDNYKYLEDTNAKLKILYRNKFCSDSEYNGVQAIDGNLGNLYIAEFADDIDKILDFYDEFGILGDDKV